MPRWPSKTGCDGLSSDLGPGATAKGEPDLTHSTLAELATAKTEDLDAVRAVAKTP